MSTFDVAAQIISAFLLISVGCIARVTADRYNAFLERMTGGITRGRASRIAGSQRQKNLIAVVVPVVFITLGVVVLVELIVSLAR
ncbi:hypothetical protein POF50_033210 [Streptomyces sp. SL13]|jgi:hypothetical protein|uniref:Uncharacterized protein n=1 Tax=Streptantibioticus silvisoli TaxID=2705255 RepID=A0AA90HCK2_9ACTN|nr:hypothetical protein [Streptantibioticus silvisoli]MDI5964126.1 hypothetical protein [Streptantibioticus silvisoli]MDI5974149.1 hypothetical protein [Streptantibioticus silvisoli]